MEGIQMGVENLYVKGIAKSTYYDFETGNICGYDRVPAETAFSSSVNLGELVGGMNNALIGIIPDTARLSGTYTSQAFSLEQRRNITGGTLKYGAKIQVMEVVTAASGGVLAVSKTPVRHYGQAADEALAWCYVQPEGQTEWQGTNYGVNPSTKVVNYTAVAGQKYNVYYFVENSSAQELAIPTLYKPAVATVQIQLGVYRMQNSEATGSTFYGWLYIVVPRAVFTGDAGINASQTGNATTDYAWQALMPGQDDNAEFVVEAGAVGGNCGNSASNMAYYILVPCDSSAVAIDSVFVAGNTVSVGVGATKQIPVKLLMRDGSVITPAYDDFSYVSGTQAKATVNTLGQVTGVAEGSSVVTITHKEVATLTTTCNVTVTA